MSPASGVGHYENFPVASWLCPCALRPAVVAIYGFARTADDIADEGGASPEQRRADLQAYRTELHRVAAGAAPAPRWASVFAPLQRAIDAHALPLALLNDLLDAFLQDTAVQRYADRATLLDYCRRSANPVGRLLLHLYRPLAPIAGSETALAQSDAICTALQLINFWQDPSLDHARGRIYLPQEAWARHGVDEATLLARSDSAATQALIADECRQARELMLQGAPLALALPGRLGWELRGVVQGGLRILDRIAALDHATLSQRPSLGATDWPLIAWRALLMPGIPRQT
ncbi:squalene synthase HpnC [Rivibacter subsaxonicus]|uniref:Squalene synthase HpnC n=1 Tax=Rivibacter subsaxonicus TaxID=457575 RepID=A0A4Q7VNV0_9BURK|nr:squalene synthase HpnC [Rivibacter subsaxonicus]RZT98061.1 squalene synthase HpnC [Rivibacter subsaxonicus]